MRLGNSLARVGTTQFLKQEDKRFIWPASRVPKSHLGDGFCHSMRLGDVVLWRTSMGDGAVSAIAGADVAEDHEGGGAVLPALADVGAVGFLADGMEVELAHQALEPHIVGAAGRFDLEP